MKPENLKLIIKTITIIIILIGLGIYNTIANGERYRLELKEQAEWNMGGLYVKSVNDSTFYAESNTDSVVGINYKRALPGSDTLKVGDLLKIKSVHLGGDTVDVKFIHISRTRNAKIWLSVIPFLIAGFLFFKYFQFDKNIKRFKIK
jgi:hypothetical protein